MVTERASVLMALTLALVPLGDRAEARQAISVSLTECSAIFGEMTGFTSAGSTPERREKAARMSAAMHSAALREARREGIADPDAHVAHWFARLQDKWDGRFQDITLIGENKDWIDYCRSLGKDRGVLPLPD